MGTGEARTASRAAAQATATHPISASAAEQRVFRPCGTIFGSSDPGGCPLCRSCERRRSRRASEGAELGVIELDGQVVVDEVVEKRSEVTGPGIEA